MAIVHGDMRQRAAVLVLPLLLGSCALQHYQSSFSAAAIEARQFDGLFIIFLVVCAIMYLLVIAFLILSLVRRNRNGAANVAEECGHHRSNPQLRVTLIGWSLMIGAGLVGLAIASFLGDRSMANAAGDPKLAITITANQWWWDVQYLSSDPSKAVRTANELHLPVGVPVRIFLKSSDVIHSLWVPSLAGKQDLIPGRLNDISITPTKVGLYRGQCAEFCGLQHAHMALTVDVEAKSDFVKWWNYQMRPALPPTMPLAQKGYAFVTTRACSSCHRILGTRAKGRSGPDLTHLASRRSIAGGTMPMNGGNLYGWVANPQALKPGSHMPAVGLEPDQLHAVVAYLETLR